MSKKKKKERRALFPELLSSSIHVHREENQHFYGKVKLGGL